MLLCVYKDDYDVIVKVCLTLLFTAVLSFLQREHRRKQDVNIAFLKRFRIFELYRSKRLRKLADVAIVKNFKRGEGKF